MTAQQALKDHLVVGSGSLLPTRLYFPVSYWAEALLVKEARPQTPPTFHLEVSRIYRAPYVAIDCDITHIINSLRHHRTNRSRIDELSTRARRLPSWEFRVPQGGTNTCSTGITIDSNFYGFTPLNDPIKEDHQVE